MPLIHFAPMVHSAGTIIRKLKLTRTSSSSAVAKKCVEVYLYCTVISHDIYFVVALRQSDLHQFQTVILEECPSVSTVTSALKLRENVM